MKLAAPFLFLALTSPAMAQEKRSPPPFVSSDQIAVWKCNPKTFENLPKLADRLGVKPKQDGGSMIFTLCDGRQYDFIEIIDAVLDRLDKAAR